jgi:hypothetical protein
MRSLCTSLGAWDTIAKDTQGTHGKTFPLAIVSAVMESAGQPEPDCFEGWAGPPPVARDYDLLLVSMMDPRHMWALPGWLDAVRCPRLASARGAGDPLVIVGGQAATAPAPIEAMADIVFIGEAEAGLPALLRALDATRAAGLPRPAQLEVCAGLPGVFVPSVHRREREFEIVQVYADDIGITLRQRLDVNLRTIHRVEIARGCKGPAHTVSRDPTKNAACGFCVLGWRSRYRENSAEDIAAALAATAAEGHREVHLSAGDAEGHSQIEALRGFVRDHGLRDHGWTGRLDTVRDCSVSAGKQFAFGLEGASHRLRAAIGKGRLTAEYVIEKLGAFWQAGGRRTMLHLIGGLPSEGPDDHREYSDLLRALEDLSYTIPGGEPIHLQIGRQPFGPLPHTPMQWFAPGLTTDALGEAAKPYLGGRLLNVYDKSGQSEPDALLNAVVMRGGAEVLPMLMDGRPRLRPGRAMRGQFAAWVRSYGLEPERYLGAWDVDAPTPWEFVQSAFPKAEVRKAYHRIARMLA